MTISIHALLAESDWSGSQQPTGTTNFYPRSPCGERRKSNKLAGQKLVFLSTLSLRRATARRASRQQPAGISIHALLAESDLLDTVQVIIVIVFLSTLSLRRATPATSRDNKNNIFLSTLSLRRATVMNNIIFMPREFLSTLSLRRATILGRVEVV